MLTLTLTPNRGDQDRYVRLVTYRRRFDHVNVFGHKSTPLDWNSRVGVNYSQIKQQPAEPELREQWLEHLAAQRALAVANASCPHEGCDQRHFPPTVTRAGLIARGIITPH